MLRPTLALTALALTALGTPTPQRPAGRFKEEAITIEYTATNGEAALKLQAETEVAFEAVELRSPFGGTVLEMRGPGGQPLVLSGFVLESRETTLDELVATYPDGLYDLRGRSTDGRALVGRAKLSHRMPATPDLLFPSEGLAGVSTKDLEVRWTPDPAVARYRVVLEQGDNDGLSVELPAGSSSLRVPEGVLRPGTETLVEIGAVGPEGNCTLVEAVFTTG